MINAVRDAKRDAVRDGNRDANGYAIRLDKIRLDEIREESSLVLSSVENFCETCAQFNRGDALKENQKSAICQHKDESKRRYPFARVDDKACAEYTGTLAYWLRPLMMVKSIKTDHCAICGRRAPLNDHHVVKRSAGELYVNGKKLQKPTITLCGFGNVLTDSDGRMFCHGAAEQHYLHFKAIDGQLAYLWTDEQMDGFTALELEGWRLV